MFEQFITDAAYLNNIPVPWVQAVIEVESNWNPDAYNPNDPTGAWGLMQLLYRTAQSLGYTGTPEGLFDPQTNIDLGSKLLGQLRVQYGDDFRRIYSAYNSGDPDRWETSTEVYNNVMRALEALDRYSTVQAGFGPGVMLLLVLGVIFAMKRGF